MAKEDKFTDTFLQPRTEVILEQVGEEFGLTKKEAINYFLLYYKEFVLKNMSTGKFSHMRIPGLCTMTPSKKKTLSFKASKRNTKQYQPIIENIIKYANINEESVRLEQIEEKKYNDQRIRK